MKGLLFAFVLGAFPCGWAAGDDSPSVKASEYDVALGLRGPDYWAGIPRHPAVVNPVGREKDGTWISLAGEWAFTNFPHASGKCTVKFKFLEPWLQERTMMVLGCWEAQGLGGPGMGVPHLGEDPLVGATLAWTLAGADGTVYAKGSQPLGTCTAGTVRSVLKTAIVVPAIPRPTKVTLTVTLSAQSPNPNNRTIEQSNNWAFWIFPKMRRLILSDRTVVCAPDAPEADAARKAGKNLILVSNQTGAPNYRLGWWWIGKQAGTAFVPHGIFGDFPQEPHRHCTSA